MPYRITETHALISLRLGLRPELLEHVKFASMEDVQASTAGIPGLSALEYAVIRYTDEVTLNIKVSDATFDALKALLGEREIVELTVTSGTYNAVNRILVPLEFGQEDEATCTMKGVDELSEALNA